MILGGGIYAAWSLSGSLPSPETAAIWLRDQGHWAPLIIVLLMILHCIVPFPAELPAMVSGAVFGFAFGTVVIWVGAMIGAALSFWIARRLGQVFVHRMLSQTQNQTLDRWVRDQGALTLLSARLVPVIAFNLINYAAGLSPVRFGTFLWTTAIGILPITCLSVWIGAQMREMDWPLAVGVCITVLTALWAVHFAVRHRTRNN